VNLFFDTSALVKYFHPETGTEQVTALIQDEANTVWLSELARVEFCSALFRRFRARELDEKQLATALAGFDETLANFQVQALGSPMTEEAERLLRKYGKTEGLRTLDALHLASFSLLAEKDWQFVAADTVLCHVAQREGFGILQIQT